MVSGLVRIAKITKQIERWGEMLIRLQEYSCEALTERGTSSHIKDDIAVLTVNRDPLSLQGNEESTNTRRRYRVSLFDH